MDVGERIAGRFEIEQQIISGGMGVVFRGRDRGTGDSVAIKLMRRDVDTDVRRFMREAAILASLDDPGVVSYVSHGLTPVGDPYLVMRWLDGESLSDTLARGGLSIGQTAAMGARIGAALGAAHAAGIVHRDVKPSNLVLVGGDPAEAVLIDFGIAAGGGARLTATGVIFGTPSYMPPEQIRGERELQPQSDVFSLGAVLYECLAGRPAFPGENYRAIQVKVMLAQPPPLPLEVPVELDAVIRRMLAKSPEDRPADGAAVAEALGLLGDFQGDAPVAQALPSNQSTQPLAPATGACVMIEGLDLDSIASALDVPDEARLERLGPQTAVATFAPGAGDRASEYAAELSRARPDATVAVAVGDDIDATSEHAAGAIAAHTSEVPVGPREQPTLNDTRVFVGGVARTTDPSE